MSKKKTKQKKKSNKNKQSQKVKVVVKVNGPSSREMEQAERGMFNALMSPNVVGPFRIPGQYCGGKTSLGQAVSTHVLSLSAATRVGIIGTQGYYLTNTSGVEMALCYGSVTDTATEWTAVNIKEYGSTTGSMESPDWGLVYPGIAKMNDLRTVSCSIELAYEGSLTSATGSIVIFHLPSDHALSDSSAIAYFDARNVNYDNLMLNAYSTVIRVSDLVAGPLTVPGFPLSPKAFEFGTNAPGETSSSRAWIDDYMLPFVALTGTTEPIRVTYCKNFEYIPELGTDQTPFAGTRKPPGDNHDPWVQDAFNSVIDKVAELVTPAHYTHKGPGGKGSNAYFETWQAGYEALGGMSKAYSAASNLMGGW
jgi:hypothetical protein